MALNTFKCNHLMPLRFKWLKHSQNEVSVSAGSRTVSGSDFRMVGLETVRLLCPYLVVLRRSEADRVYDFD